MDRYFNRKNTLDVIVSDLTYVRVYNKWHYTCTILYLYNREIISYSVGETKTSSLVFEAFSNINRPLSKVNIFHSDREPAFKNQAIDALLKTHKIYSLSEYKRHVLRWGWYNRTKLKTYHINTNILS